MLTVELTEDTAKMPQQGENKNTFATIQGLM